MLTISYDENLSKNTWNFYRLGHTSGRLVMTKCTNGHIGSLVDHVIAADGTVSPSVVCQHEGCDYHEFIKLDEWQKRDKEFREEAK